MDRLERQRRDTRLSTWVDAEGMWNLRGRFDPLTGVTLAAKLDATVETLFAESTPELAPEYLVVIDAGTPGETVEIPTRVLAELMNHPDTDVVGVVVCNGTVLHAPGQLDQGRTNRVANRAQRRALRALYTPCAIPGCNVTFDRCHLHHIIWWRHGGITDLANLLPLCTHHHGKIHHDHWAIELGPNRELTVGLPDGTTMTTGPPTIRAA